jgi:peptidoglycan-associated lipoprotein
MIKMKNTTYSRNILCLLIVFFTISFNKFLFSEGISSGSQEDLIVNVGDRVFFNYDSFELDKDATELLEDQVRWLKKHKSVSITIEGHADERNAYDYALAIGLKRSLAVKNYLIALGIDAYRISVITYGYNRPAVIGSNGAAAAQNRRAVTKVN